MSKKNAPRDSQAPAPQPVARRADRPRPLLRQALTITPPWDTNAGPPLPATVELIVLADGVHLDDVTATEADVPELADAGWSGHSAGPLSFFVRFIW